MKKAIAIVALLVSSLGISQNTIEKTIGEFSELKVFDLLEVELIQSTENKIKIVGENAEDVVVVNKNGKLKIRMKIDDKFKGENTQVTLYYTKIDIIDVNEGAIVGSQDTIKQFEIDLRAQEGGEIKVNVDVSYVLVNSATGGKVEVSGTTKKQQVQIYTGGELEAKALKSEDVEVTVNAGGKAYVNASNDVKAKVRAGGDVYIYGNPKTISEDKVLGGRVEKVEE
ncbi:head GIN domain-containing protein [Mangrovimonas aestuarii]|uniref:head GIN domain-containing protein n=1 Tax=Mangrovimonas aestuarii TaxID=3018443 RepID=UPI00237836B9|nr:head GIN domain-containing protein [Mangrovimonas aestuarii]